MTPVRKPLLQRLKGLLAGVCARFRRTRPAPPPAPQPAADDRAAEEAFIAESLAMLQHLFQAWCEAREANPDAPPAPARPLTPGLRRELRREHRPASGAQASQTPSRPQPARARAHRRPPQAPLRRRCRKKPPPGRAPKHA